MTQTSHDQVSITKAKSIFDRVNVVEDVVNILHEFNTVTKTVVVYIDSKALSTNQVCTESSVSRIEWIINSESFITNSVKHEIPIILDEYDEEAVKLNRGVYIETKVIVSFGDTDITGNRVIFVPIVNLT